MTDTLIARLRSVLKGTCDDAADALEALQAEVARLTPLQFRKAPCHKFCESTAFEIEIRQLRAEVTRLTEQCRLFDAAAYKAKVEARTLVEDMQSRITALEGQEPVAMYDWEVGSFVWLTAYKYDLHHKKPLFLAAGAAPTTQESCKHGTPYRYPCDVCDTPTLEQLIIKENDRVLRGSLEGKYAMAQAAPTKENNHEPHHARTGNSNSQRQRRVS